MWIFKCVLIGDSGSGKTSMIQRYAEGTFPARTRLHENYSFSLNLRQSDDEEGKDDNDDDEGEQDSKLVEMVLWDTDGCENHEHPRWMCYPETDVFLVCLDLSGAAVEEDEAAMAETVQRWVGEAGKHSPGTPVVLVGTKADLVGEGAEEDRTQRENMIEKIKPDVAIKYVECSSKTGDGLHNAFLEVARMKLQHQRNSKKQRSRFCLLL